MKKSGIAIGIIAALISLFFYHALRPQETPLEKVHFHAGFKVFQGDEQVDFSDLKYMSISPCSDEEHGREELTPEEQQKEKVHLHDGIGDVAHIHQPDVRWRDLFLNIGYPIDEQVTAYVNSEQIENILDKPIEPFESVIFLQGENSRVDEKIGNPVTREYIDETGKKSETCQ